LAFRTGSRKKQRIHIFWQRRVRADGRTTPYWFPAKTKAGALREDRLVVPIPLESHWRDVKPILLPNAPVAAPVQKALVARGREGEAVVSVARKMAIVRSQSRHLGGLPPGKAAVITAGGIRYVERGDYVPEPEPVKLKRAPRAPSVKNDPKYVAAARELRDRFLEHVNDQRFLPAEVAKYEVGRAQIEMQTATMAHEVITVKQLPNAA
jgi:hypothetical protein